MTLSRLIRLLERRKAEHGGDIRVLIVDGVQNVRSVRTYDMRYAQELNGLVIDVSFE